jgi:hypothetical protein
VKGAGDERGGLYKGVGIYARRMGVGDLRQGTVRLEDGDLMQGAVTRGVRRDAGGQSFC